MADPDRSPVATRAQLASVGRVVTTLTYVLGTVGVVLGARAFVDGEPLLATAVWVLTFAAGAGLQLAALLARGMVALLRAVDRLEADVAALRPDG